MGKIEINVIKGLKINKISLTKYKEKYNLSKNYFNSSKNYTQEKIIMICEKSGISIFDCCNDSDFIKYYDEFGKLVKIERK